MPLFSNITCEKATDTSLRVIGFNQGPQSETLSPESYLIRQRNAKSTLELYEAIQKQIVLSSPLNFSEASIKQTEETKEKEVIKDEATGKGEVTEEDAA